MGSLKSLFLGVHASNATIRTLFLPFCYLVLTSPFILLVLRYFGFRVENSIPHQAKAPEFVPQVLISFVAVFLATRIISGTLGSKNGGGKRRVQLLPFWVPGPRHWGNVVFGGEAWLRKVRDASIDNITAYNASGAKHNLIFSSQLLEQVLSNTTEVEEADLTKWTVVQNAFNLPPSSKSTYLDLRPSLLKAYDDEIFKGKEAQNLVAGSLKILSESLTDLVTFNSSIVDQMPWERVAGVELTDGNDEAEFELYTLFNEFFCNVILAPITGPQFPESYQLLASDLSTFNQVYYALALGLPRFFPAKGLPGAKLAKKRLLKNFTRLFQELTEPKVKRVPDDDESESGEETDADAPTPLTALNQFFEKNEVPIQARASITLHLLHKLVAQVVPLAFWTVLHIYHSSSTTQDKNDSPLVKIRQETKNWAQATQPPSIHPSFPAPPEIAFASTAPAFSPTTFPHLRSCINEARRLYVAPVTAVQVTKPLTISETEPTRPGEQLYWELDRGSYVDVGLSQSLINTSAANYLSPHTFKADRFAHTPAPLAVTYSPDAIASSSSSEPYCSALLVSLVAGVTQLWDISPAPKKSMFEHMRDAQAAAAGEKVKEKDSREGVWRVPKAVDGASVKVPGEEIRVRIRRREGLEGPKKKAAAAAAVRKREP
ncbi:hypothetical protein BS50DRAFT_579681 [Corynespora cassiicola Philippines]|uniref:Cytochrome P450 n=1 Tax=Corynespora cassiicola Philippines TaxID=1448308 RepID=A0A2T2N4D0_CORCC|nr:hypothetical protein BS50DRAFT_579681 [Corynespora cassiicola Philippines]